MDWNSMSVATQRDKDFLYNEIVIQDQYRMLRLKDADLNYIIDIGANVGYFSLLSKEVIGNAIIIAVEPIPETFDRLAVNTAGTDIRLLKAAIGDGGDLFIKRATNSEPVCDQCVSHPTDQEPIKSITFYNLFKKFKVPFDSNYMIKFDCEGGETSFYHDENFPILKNAVYITGEVHFDTVGTKEYPPKEEVLSLIRELENFFDLDISFSDHIGHLNGFRKKELSLDQSWIKQKEEEYLLRQSRDSYNPFLSLSTNSISQKGIKLFSNGDLEAAKNHFFEVLRRDPTNVENLFNLGVVYYKEGNTFEAIEYLLKIIRTGVYFKNALLLLCKILDAEGRLEVARPLLEKNPNINQEKDLKKYYDKLQN